MEFSFEGIRRLSFLDGWSIRMMMRFLDRVFLLRPILFYPVWTFFLAGVWGGNGSRQGSTPLNRFDLAITLTGLSLLMGSVFILNQIQDRETDRANGKLFLLANGIVPVSQAVFQALLMIVLGMAAGMYMGVHIAVGFLLLFVLSGWLYNFPPAAWKDRPLLGLLTNAVGGLIIYVSGWMTAAGPSIDPVRAAAYMLAGGAVYLNTTLPDIEGDRKTGKRTFCVRFGLSATLQWACILEFLAVIMAFLSRDWILAVPGTLVFPLFVVSVIKRSMKNSIRATKVSVLALSLAVFLVFPFYAVPVLIVYVLSKWYYRRRFDFDYPSFKTS